mgnify:CR=1 FL=1
MRIETLDLGFQGTPQVIASYLLEGPVGNVLVETGPGSTLPALLTGLDRLGLAPGDVGDVLVSHIHLDHAGAAGWWAQQGARVHVHPRGAPHLIDPSKLLASAGRIYGDRMETLWGEVLPAPAERVVAVEDGATLEVGGLRIEAYDTPGHARHHLVYALEEVVFTGDAAGIQLPGNGWSDLPAPPPEFDLEQWLRTLERIRDLGARTLYRTHFGPSGDIDTELSHFAEVLAEVTRWVREMRQDGLDREAMIDDFTARIRRLAAKTGLDSRQLEAYEIVNPRAMSVDGIARYLNHLDGDR